MQLTMMATNLQVAEAINRMYHVTSVREYSVMIGSWIVILV